MHSLAYNPSEHAEHSFRRGGAHYAFQAGIPIELIKNDGGLEIKLGVALPHGSIIHMPTLNKPSFQTYPHQQLT